MNSMTGYAKKTFHIEKYGNISMEVKSVNGKNLNINFRMPVELNSLEIKIRKIILQYIKRGNVFFAVRTDYSPEFVSKSLKEIGRRIKLSELKDDNQGIILSRFIDMMTPELSISMKNEKCILESVKMTMEMFNRMRKKEGSDIERELKKYIKSINRDMKIIKKYSKYSVNAKKEKLKAIIKENDQLIKENIMIYAEKIDISEEMLRMNSHIEKFTHSKSGASMGFILQEMLRETNTMGSKSEYIGIIDAVLRIKGNIDKLKEQSLNVE